MYGMVCKVCVHEWACTLVNLYRLGARLNLGHTGMRRIITVIVLISSRNMVTRWAVGLFTHGILSFVLLLHQVHVN